MNRRFPLDAFDPTELAAEVQLELATASNSPAAAGSFATKVATDRTMTPAAKSPAALDLAPALRDPQPIENLFVPEHYEPKYAYPLIVWLQADGTAASDFTKLMSQISSRNYFGFSLSGTTPAANNNPDVLSISSDDNPIVAVEERLFETVKQLRRDYHIHSERIFIAGFGDGATLALQLGLRRPEWFAGIASLAGQFPNMPLALNRFRDLIGKRVFLGTGSRNASCGETDLLRTGRLLHTAGLRVCTRFYDAGHELSADMLTEVNRWVMAEMYAPATGS
ncbi:MAG: hypothetical protein HZA46_10265 [Planctomycetales bacterium]|nr:hypothetical protein [Planctomycetales bacterium]